ncbi:hypothetical protein GLUCOINTEAF2_0203604 [Komagataeibacter intermedius AF2]|uniref:Uncharacterized protein n=2 Tax=Komagataeibacter intermedius TaxID=66229 RepID=A0A0N1F8X7_9PROT|nr:hypothetical protein GLUCOINTEAF2_0203604 [Komagataeibacter intermedius AF2]
MKSNRITRYMRLAHNRPQTYPGCRWGNMMLFEGYHTVMQMRPVLFLRTYAPLTLQLCLFGIPWKASATPTEAPGVAYFTPQNASSSSPHSLPLSSPSITPNSRTLQQSFYQSVAPRSFATAPGLKNLDHVGPFAIEHSQSSPIPLEQGTTITAAYPVKGVQGMDLVVNAFGGHRQTNTGSNVGSAAVTAGVRFKW